MKVVKLASVASLIAFVGLANAVCAEETVGDDINHATKKSVNAVKKTGRELSDKGCETVDGKIRCAGKRARHGIENKVDDLKEKAN